MRLVPARSMRSKQVALFAAVLATVLLVPIAFAAERNAPPGNGSAMRIVAPRTDALLSGDRVRVAVRTSPRTRSFRAFVGNRQVSGAFRRRGNLRVASLPRGAFEPGANFLYLRARLAGGRKSFVHRRVYLVHRSPSLLAEAATGRGRAGAAVLSTTRSRHPAVVLRASLNGEPAGQALSRRGIRHRAELGAGDGLRFGRNRLRIVGYDSAGRYDVETETFLVPRDRPLAGAGPDRAALRGRPIRLSAKSSRPARRGAHLSYGWQVVKAPRGAKPKLPRAGSATPGLRPNGFGTYRLRLTVSEGRRVGDRATASAAGGKVSTDVVTLDVRPDDPPIGVPIHTLTATGTISINGKDVPQTGGAISYAVLDRKTRKELASGSVAATAAGLKTIEEAFENRKEPRYMVVASSRTGVPPALVPALKALFAELGAGELGERDRREIVFAEGDGFAFSVLGFPGAPKGSAFVNIERQQARGAQAGDISGFLQLRPYAPPPPAAEPHGPQVDSLYGFVFGAEPSFDTHAPGGEEDNRMVIAGRVYDAQWPGEVLEGGSGFHLVGLDPASLQLLDADEEEDEEDEEQSEFNLIFPTNTGDAAIDQKWTHSLAEKAQSVLGSNGLLFLQSIGHPHPTTAAWGKLIDVVEAAGGTRAVIGGLDGSGGYALVGTGGDDEVQRLEVRTGTHDTFAIGFRGASTENTVPTGGPARSIEQAIESLPTVGGANVLVREVPGERPSWDVEFERDLGNRELPPLYAYSGSHVPPEIEVMRQGGLPKSYPQAENSEQLTHEPARLVGYLARSHDSDYRASLATVAPTPGGGLVEIAYGPGKPFPPFASAGEKAADAYIAKQLNLFDGSGVRANYYKDYYATWGVKLTQLTTLCPKGTSPYSCAGQGFTEAEFEKVRKQLQIEIPKLADVVNLIGHLQAPFDKQQTRAYVDLADIGRKISEGIRPPDVSTDAISAALLGQMFGLAGEVLEGPEAAAAGALAAGLEKAGQLLQPNGSPVLDELKVATGKLAGETLERYEEASKSLAELGLVVASDYGKLSAVSERTGTGGAWHWSQASEEGAQLALSKGTQRWYWQTLLPIPYKLWWFEPTKGSSSNFPLQNAREYTCHNAGRYGMEPFADSADVAQDYQVTGVSSTGSVIRQVRALGMEQPEWGARRPNVYPPSAALLNPLFEDPEKSKNGLGMFKADFYSHRYFVLGWDWRPLWFDRGECGD